MTQLSRREFATLAAAAAAAPFAIGQTPSAAAALTAKELVDRITAADRRAVEGRDRRRPQDRRSLDGGDRHRHDGHGVARGAAAGRRGRRQRRRLEPADVLRQGRRAHAPGAARPGRWTAGRTAPGDPASSACCGAARPGVRGQERVHRHAQARRRASLRPLETARARSAGRRPGPGHGLDEASGGRRSAALRHPADDRRRRWSRRSARASASTAACASSAIRRRACAGSACCPARRRSRRR